MLKKFFNALSPKAQGILLIALSLPLFLSVNPFCYDIPIQLEVLLKIYLFIISFSVGTWGIDKIVKNLLITISPNLKNILLILFGLFLFVSFFLIENIIPTQFKTLLYILKYSLSFLGVCLITWGLKDYDYLGE